MSDVEAGAYAQMADAAIQAALAHLDGQYRHHRPATSLVAQALAAQYALIIGAVNAGLASLPYRDAAGNPLTLVTRPEPAHRPPDPQIRGSPSTTPT